MKRLVKRALVLAVLAAVASSGYQVWEFMSFYNRARDTLERELLAYEDVGRNEFLRRLLMEEKKIGLDLDPAKIKVDVDRIRREVRVEFRYTRELRVLVFSVQKEMVVWRSLRNVDFVG